MSPQTGWLELMALMSFEMSVLGNISIAFFALSVGGNISATSAYLKPNVLFSINLNLSLGYYICCNIKRVIEDI